MGINGGKKKAKLHRRVSEWVNERGGNIYYVEDFGKVSLAKCQQWEKELTTRELRFHIFQSPSSTLNWFSENDPRLTLRLCLSVRPYRKFPFNVLARDKAPTKFNLFMNNFSRVCQFLFILIGKENTFDTVDKLKLWPRSILTSASRA